MEPRKWQIEALTAWEENFKGVVSVVTGGGKTFFAMMCISTFFKSYPEGEVLIIVPTIALLDQWYVSLVDEMGISLNEISVFSGQEKSKNLGKINLIVINTGRNFQKTSPSEKMLIVDECHRSGSPQNALALIPNCRATLGLSATPVRQYDDGFDIYIKPILGDVIYEYTYVDALRDKVICPFELLNIDFDLLPKEELLYKSLSKKIAITYQQYKKGLPVGEKLKILLQKRSIVSAIARMRIPITAKIIDGEKGNRIIVFFERIEQVESLYKILKERDSSVTKYHSKIPPAIRRENLRLYKMGVYDILLTCKALDEGLNVPNTSVAIIASSTMSIRQRIQRMGRVLRPYPGKEHAEIYTLFATKAEKNHLKRVDESLDDLFQVRWLKGSVKTDGKDIS